MPDPYPWHRETGCTFCGMIADEVKRPEDWTDHGAAVAYTPLDPVTPGHLLVVPKHHVRDFMGGTGVFASAARIASMIAYDRGGAHNLITSAGRDATQSVMHLHIHLVPRRPGDGLHLPWTDQVRSTPTTEGITP